MYTVKEAIIVEGIYDKIKLSSFIDSLIFVTGGFSVLNNKNMQKSIRTLAEKTGVVILTDSDSAGLKIRNFVKQLLDPAQVKHAYIPEIAGKEKRKTKASSEGLLGVEGISEEIVIDALKKSGCTISGQPGSQKKPGNITKVDFFRLGLSGGTQSSKLRQRLALEMGFPSKLSANMLLDAVNRLLSIDELEEMLIAIKDENDI